MLADSSVILICVILSDINLFEKNSTLFSALYEGGNIFSRLVPPKQFHILKNVFIMSNNCIDNLIQITCIKLISKINSFSLYLMFKFKQIVCKNAPVSYKAPF